jgi:hypothetical protein
MLTRKVRPIGREDKDGENESEHDVHDHAGAERGERLASRSRQIANARRQADAEETEDDVQVLRSLTGATRVGATDLLNSAKP